MFPVSKAQEVIAPLGNFYQNTQGSISITIGEVVSETVSSATHVFTQGFNQPSTLFSSVVNNSLDNKIAWVFPVPCANSLTIQLSENNKSPLNCTIYSPYGQIINSIYLDNLYTMVNTTSFSNGIYHLVITDDLGNKLSTLRVLKQ
ncbi:MAG: T9SS type A sorting domain-containing protein [Bacteroidetes bacterium]|nr:T9SS type A sorting domain-containing protein [Bacteroidota bacterium]